MRAALGRPAATDDIADDRSLALMILVVSDLARATVADASPGVEHADPVKQAGSGAGFASAEPAAVLLAALVEHAEHRIAQRDPMGRR